jgi:hypothetical protein
MGKPIHLWIYFSEYIGKISEPGELKHLINQRNRYQRYSVSSGERTRMRQVVYIKNKNDVEKSTVEGDSPVLVENYAS